MPDHGIATETSSSRSRKYDRRFVLFKNLIQIDEMIIIISLPGKVQRTKKQRQFVFAKRKFYLDLKNLSSASVKDLADNLVLLGGVSD